MRKSLSLFAIFILGILGLIIPFITLTAFKPLHQQNYTVNQQITGMNETDFINTMFLCSSFFENWSETNYFINPTLKTSKSLTYNDKWYLDFLKDSYSTGISFDKPGYEFMDLYKNWDVYAKQYSIDKFYDVDKKQFLKELTNFVYSFTNKYNLTKILNKLKTNINDLQLVNLIEDNWKLIDSKDIDRNSEKYYIGLYGTTGNWWFFNPKKGKEIGELSLFYKCKIIYRWDGVDEPQTPTINKNTGEIIDWSVENQNKVKDFLNKYLDVIIQEKIRIQQGGNPNYDDPNLGSQRIIFYFEIINNLNKSSIGTILTKKSIYRMILTIDERKNIIAGSLELTHLKQYWSGYDYNNYRYTDDLGFLFSFMKDKENTFNFSAETYNYYQGNTPNTGKEIFE